MRGRKKLRVAAAQTMTKKRKTVDEIVEAHRYVLETVFEKVLSPESWALRQFVPGDVVLSRTWRSCITARWSVPGMEMAVTD